MRSSARRTTVKRVIYGSGDAVFLLRELVGASATLERFVERRGCALVGVDVSASADHSVDLSADPAAIADEVRRALATTYVPSDVQALVFACVPDALSLRGLAMHVPEGHLVAFIRGRTLVANIGNDILDMGIVDDVEVWLARVIDEVVGPALADDDAAEEW